MEAETVPSVHLCPSWEGRALPVPIICGQAAAVLPNSGKGNELTRASNSGRQRFREDRSLGALFVSSWWLSGSVQSEHRTETAGS